MKIFELPDNIRIEAAKYADEKDDERPAMGFANVTLWNKDFWTKAQELLELAK